MPASISGVIRRVQTVLQDALGTRWDEAELLDWFNDARREFAVARPFEFAKRVAISLEAGPLQRLPAEAFQLIRINCNLASAAPRVPGRAISLVEGRVLDAMNPSWQDAKHVPYARIAKHYAYEPNELDSFYVYPGNDGTGVVEASVAVLPVDATSTAEPIGVRDIFLNALVDYVLYRAFSKDADHPGNAERAAGHYAAFAGAVGAQAMSENNSTPAGART